MADAAIGEGLSAHPPAAVAAAAEYVRGRQTPDGGFSFYRSGSVEEPSPADTYYALLTLAAAGDRVPRRERCVQWLQSRQLADGDFSGLAAAWYVTQALELLGAAPQRPWSDWLAARAATLFDMAAAGTRADASRQIADACRLVQLWLLAFGRLEPRQRTAVEALLRRLSDPGGGFPRARPTLADSLRAVRLARCAGLIPDRGVLAFARDCEDAGFGFRSARRGRSTHVDALAAGLEILAEFDRGPRHPAALQATLAGCQHAGGGFARQPGALPTLRDTCLAVGALLRLADRKAPRPVLALHLGVTNAV